MRRNIFPGIDRYDFVGVDLRHRQHERDLESANVAIDACDHQHAIAFDCETKTLGHGHLHHRIAHGEDEAVQRRGRERQRRHRRRFADAEHRRQRHRDLKRPYPANQESDGWHFKRAPGRDA